MSQLLSLINICLSLKKNDRIRNHGKKPKQTLVLRNIITNDNDDNDDESGLIGKGMTTTKTTTTTTTTTNYENSNRRAEQNQQQSKRQENQQNKQVNNLREIDFFSNLNIYISHPFDATFYI